MLQNRVDPLGNIIRTSARGAWMGNRGLLHNEHREIVRSHKLNAWITCKLEFKGRKRQVMTPNLYTELFFLDEATAFSAGHRPCFECRREDANTFKKYWIKGNPEYGFIPKTRIGQIDNILHNERMNTDKTKKTFMTTTTSENIPDGAFILIDDHPFLICDAHIYQWTPAGYEAPQPLPQKQSLTVLTPKSIVNAFRAGYLPQMAITTDRPCPDHK